MQNIADRQYNNLGNKINPNISLMIKNDNNPCVIQENLRKNRIENLNLIEKIFDNRDYDSIEILNEKIKKNKLSKMKENNQNKDIKNHLYNYNDKSKDSLIKLLDEKDKLIYNLKDQNKIKNNQNDDFHKIYKRIGKNAAIEIRKHDYWSIKAHDENSFKAHIHGVQGILVEEGGSRDLFNQLFENKGKFVQTGKGTEYKSGKRPFIEMTSINAIELFSCNQ